MKLVRNKIPDIPDIHRRYRFHRLESDEKYLEYLKKKLIEESKEAATSQTKSELISELIDITEVIDEVRKLLGITVLGMNLFKKKKLKEKGGFSKRLMMISR